MKDDLAFGDDNDEPHFKLFDRTVRSLPSTPSCTTKTMSSSLSDLLCENLYPKLPSMRAPRPNMIDKRSKSESVMSVGGGTGRVGRKDPYENLLVAVKPSERGEERNRTWSSSFPQNLDSKTPCLDDTTANIATAFSKVDGSVVHNEEGDNNGGDTLKRNNSLYPILAEAEIEGRGSEGSASIVTSGKSQSSPATPSGESHHRTGSNSVAQPPPPPPPEELLPQCELTPQTRQSSFARSLYESANVDPSKFLMNAGGAATANIPDAIPPPPLVPPNGSVNRSGKGLEVADPTPPGEGQVSCPAPTEAPERKSSFYRSLLATADRSEHRSPDSHDASGLMQKEEEVVVSPIAEQRPSTGQLLDSTPTSSGAVPAPTENRRMSSFYRSMLATPDGCCDPRMLDGIAASAGQLLDSIPASGAVPAPTENRRMSSFCKSLFATRDICYEPRMLDGVAPSPGALSTITSIAGASRSVSAPPAMSQSVEQATPNLTASWCSELDVQPRVQELEEYGIEGQIKAWNQIRMGEERRLEGVMLGAVVDAHPARGGEEWETTGTPGIVGDAYPVGHRQAGGADEPVRRRVTFHGDGLGGSGGELHSLHQEQDNAVDEQTRRRATVATTSGEGQGIGSAIRSEECPQPDGTGEDSELERMSRQRLQRSRGDARRTGGSPIRGGTVTQVRRTTSGNYVDAEEAHDGAGSDTRNDHQEEGGNSSPRGAERRRKPPVSNELLRRGNRETWEAISNGEAHTVKCLGCRGKMQVARSASLVFCPQCGTFSPAVPRHSSAEGGSNPDEVAQRMRYDAGVSETLQRQEYLAMIRMTGADVTSTVPCPELARNVNDRVEQKLNTYSGGSGGNEAD